MKVSSLRAQRKHLKIDVQLKITEQGKQGALIKSINLVIAIRLKPKCIYPCESKGMTDEISVMETEE